MEPESTLFGRDDRGAVLIHVAFALLALVAFTTFVADWGVLWMSRRQAQNAADAGALAGAIAIAFDDPSDLTDTGEGKQNAYFATQQNFVFGAPPDVNITSDITFPPCPPGAGNGRCIKVDVFRNQERNNPLPIFFGVLVGLTDQGIRATATAQIRQANANTCLRPWAIVDRWLEGGTTPSTFQDTYDPPGDVYAPPVPGDPGDPGTGFTIADRGLQFAIKQAAPGQGGQSVSPGWFRTIDIPRLPGSPGYEECPDDLPGGGGRGGGGGGGDTVRCNIAACGGVNAAYSRYGEDCPESIPNDLESEVYWAERGCFRVQTGNMVGPNNQGLQYLIDRDPNARWEDGDIQFSDFPPGESPRIVPIGIMDIASYLAQNPTGSGGVVRMVNILGFFIEGMGDIDANGNPVCCSQNGQAVIGRLVTVPGESIASGGEVPEQSSFMSQILLVR